MKVYEFCVPGLDDPVWIASDFPFDQATVNIIDIEIEKSVGIDAVIPFSFCSTGKPQQADQ